MLRCGVIRSTCKWYKSRRKNCVLCLRRGWVVVFPEKLMRAPISTYKIRPFTKYVDMWCYFSIPRTISDVLKGQDELKFSEPRDHRTTRRKPGVMAALKRRFLQKARKENVRTHCNVTVRNPSRQRTHPRFKKKTTKEIRYQASSPSW